MLWGESLLALAVMDKFKAPITVIVQPKLEENVCIVISRPMSLTCCSP